MTAFLIGNFILNGITGILLYLLVRKKKKIFADRYGMVVSMCGSGVLSLHLAMLFVFLIPDYLIIQVLFALGIGVFIGKKFGSLVRYQSLLSGIFHGIIGGIMGLMLGIVILNPSLCGLPSASLNMLHENMLIFTLFGTLLVIMTGSLLYYSLRV
ncbi:hypothetical protein [Metabacillus fastidiosus]|uniref:hypothetical protein n=1 Tax=Metabacillus fastidiosus TaxID=1458 RepID=UPI002E1F3C6A|nr:hypothetical protein [Metabacillus fastidiosus]